VFDFLKRKKPATVAADPLAAFDGMIESLERQGAEVRKSAATLLTLRGELTRDQVKYRGRVDELNKRLDAAARAGDTKVERSLRRDLEDTTRMLERTLEAHATADTNAKLLMEAAEGLSREVASLREERQSARARMSAGVVSEALKARTAEFDRLMKLDAARDEIERANALAELYREDQLK
jgi:phage shock protein A